jgi:8-oxo-dGTP pyrophosphatase MutT (NUDIX family)
MELGSIPMARAPVPAGSIENPIPRRAARVVLVDGQGRVLMFRGFDPAKPNKRYWFTVGGGLDEGETAVQGALRELREETGLDIPESQLEGPVWQQTADFPFDGRWYRQEQEFFAVRVDHWDVTIDGFDAEERRSIDRHHWWTIDELTGTTERFYPAELPELLRAILRS